MLGKVKVRVFAVALIALVLTLLSQGTLAYYSTVGRAANVVTSGNIQFIIHERTDSGTESFAKNFPSPAAAEIATAFARLFVSAPWATVTATLLPAASFAQSRVAARSEPLTQRTEEAETPPTETRHASVNPAPVRWSVTVPLAGSEYNIGIQ